MEVVHRICCGMDVHKRNVVACLLSGAPGGQVKKEVRTYSTMTADLLVLADWLREAQCTHVAMESTGVYWKPIYNLLEGEFELLVVNAQHLRNVPGRKTDVQDAEWIADLLRHGLVRASFIPDAPQRELRELTRYRISLVREKAQVANRVQKVLEDANIKLASVVSDVMGVSARAMLAALLEGQNQPEVLAGLARGQLRQKRAELEQALAGVVKPHHRFLLAEHLSHVDYLDEAITRVSQEIEERLRPFEQDLARLDTIPGVSRYTAEVLLAEMGSDMSRFPSDKELASWAGMCPGNCESAGKRRSGKTRQGNGWLRQALVEAAHGAGHSKNTYLSSQYHRLAGRRGKKRALVAVGHSILVIAYHILLRKESYHELGANYFDERERERVEKRLIRRLEKLGLQVVVTPLPQPVPA